MYFKPFLIEKILTVDKTQTRRLIHSDDVTVEISDTLGKVIQAVYANGRRKWRTGDTLAVCPGRGKPAVWWRNMDGNIQQAHLTTVRPSVVMPEFNGMSYYDCGKRITPDEWRDWLWSWDWDELRIRITAIRREDVRTISDYDIFAEGFSNYYEFMYTWTSFHDTPALPVVQEYCCRRDYLESALDERPADRYAAWCLSFEVHHEQ